MKQSRVESNQVLMRSLWRGLEPNKLWLDSARIKMAPKSPNKPARIVRNVQESLSGIFFLFFSERHLQRATSNCSLRISRNPRRDTIYSAYSLTLVDIHKSYSRDALRMIRSWDIPKHPLTIDLFNRKQLEQSNRVAEYISIISELAI